MKAFIVIPVFNEGKVIKNVAAEIAKCGSGELILVEDGCADNSFEEMLEIKDAYVLRHPVNRGKGAAVRTGIQLARKLAADAVVTMDGDGQHNPEDIIRMLDELDTGVDVVLGSRLINPKGMPLAKLLFNYTANLITRVFYGISVTDSTSGFRAFSKKAIELIDTKSDRYSYDAEVIREVRRHNLSFVEIPIEVRYPKYSQTKTDRVTVKEGIRIIISLIKML